MKNFKKIILLLLSAAILTGSALALELDAGTGDGFFVVDDANALSETTKQTVVDYNTWLETDCSGAQLVVVTVSYLDEYTDVAATQLMDDWGVGDRELSNGMLLLYVVQEAKGWLAVGEGIDHAFTDSMANEYLDDYFWDYVDAYEPDEAVLSITEALVSWYEDYYDADLSATGGDDGVYTESLRAGPQGYDEPRYESERSGGGLVTLLVVIVLLWLVVSLSRMTQMRRWGYTGGFWPIFWRPHLWRSWRHRAPRPPHGPGGPGGRRPGPGGPGGFGGGARPGGGMNNRPGGAGRGGSFGSPSRPGGAGRGGSGFGGGGRSGGGGAGRGGSFGGGGHSGGGGGGRSGGGGGGRR